MTIGILSQWVLCQISRNWLPIRSKGLRHLLLKRLFPFSTEDDEDPLTKSVTSFWKIDTSGPKNENELSLSKNDQWAVEILKNTVRHTGERYEIGLLW